MGECDVVVVSYLASVLVYYHTHTPGDWGRRCARRMQPKNIPKKFGCLTLYGGMPLFRSVWAYTAISPLWEGDGRNEGEGNASGPTYGGLYRGGIYL